MDAQLKIKIGADVDGAVSGVNKVASSLQKLPDVSSRATFALTNLSRVAQDAPFGFIGIANNIDPLLQSFVSLKKETGSVGGAFKALGASLAGPGGLILLSGLVTAGLTIFGDELFGTGKKAKAAKEEVDKYSKVLDGISSKVADEATKTALIVDRLKESNISRKEQIALIDQLKKISPEYFSNLDAENIKINDLNTSYQAYRRSLISTIELEIRRKELTDIINQRLKTQEQNPQASKFINDQLASGKSLLEISKELTKQNISQNNEYLKINGKYSESNAKKLKELDSQSLINASIFSVLRLLQQEDDILNKINNQSLNDLGAGFKDAENSVEKIVEVTDRIKPARIIDPAELSKLKRTQFGLDFGFNTSPFDITKAVGLDKIDVNYNTGILNAIAEAAKNAKISLDETLNTEKIKKYSDVLTNTLGGAFQDLFSSIIKGGGNALQNFGKAIQQIITQLISAAITAAIFAAIINTFGGGTGGAAQTFGGIFKDIFGSLSGIKFAKGGIVNKPTYGVFGESGSEAIVPLDRFTQMLTTAARYGFNSASAIGIANRGNDSLVARVQGSDLAFVLARTNNTYSRLG